MKRHPMFRSTLADIRNAVILLVLIAVACLSPFAIVYGFVLAIRLAWRGW